MDQKWQVCELEESNNISLSLFERYSVVSVPEGWISVLADGTMVCFWPSVDTQKKIRSLHRPKADEKGVYYKCRILLDGGNLFSPKFFLPFFFCKLTLAVEKIILLKVSRGIIFSSKSSIFIEIGLDYRVKIYALLLLSTKRSHSVYVSVSFKQRNVLSFLCCSVQSV